MSVVPSSTRGATDTDRATVSDMPNPTTRSRALPVLTGTIVLDLEHTDPGDRRYRAAELATAPAGAAVELRVGNPHPGDTPDTVPWITEAACRRSLRIDVHGDLDTVGPWLRELRAGIAHHLTDPDSDPPPVQRRRLTVVPDQPRRTWWGGEPPPDPNPWEAS